MFNHFEILFIDLAFSQPCVNLGTPVPPTLRRPPLRVEPPLALLLPHHLARPMLCGWLNLEKRVE